MYLQQFLAKSGVASRRGATDLIRDKKVKVNGKLAELGMKIDAEKDKVTVGGKTVKSVEEKVYYIVNKPIGYTCTLKDRHAEKLITELVPSEPRVYPVGRLDKDSHGLVILTNDGDFAHEFTHPSFEHEKEYVVTLEREIDDSLIAGLKKGVRLREGVARVDKLQKLGKNKVSITIHQGWNRQIRRMLGAFNYKVADLKRVRMGEYRLGGLQEGSYKNFK